jgi:proteasome lid subunit RPN8/RPN11
MPTENLRMSDRKEINRDDIRIIMDKAFGLATPLASTEGLYDLKLRLDNKEANSFHFDANSGGFVYWDKDGTRHAVEPKKIVESGAAICKSDKGEIYFEEFKLHEGLSMFVNTSCKGNFGDFVGSIHTHPGGVTSPSIQDLQVAAAHGEKISCIATRYDNYIDANDKEFKRYKVMCKSGTVPLSKDKLNEYHKLSQGLMKSYKDELFKLSKVGSLQNIGINMRGNVLIPNMNVVREGDTIKFIEEGSVPFLQEGDARRFDDATKEFLQNNFDEYIVEERRYDEDGQEEVTLRKGY